MKPFCMMIQNFEELATSQKKKDTLEILESGLEASKPENILQKFVTPSKITVDKEILNIEKFSSIHTVAFGKAADSMTRALNAIIPIKGGIVVIPKGSRSKIKGKKFHFKIKNEVSTSLSTKSKKSPPLL